MVSKKTKDISLGVLIWGTFILAFGLLGLILCWSTANYQTIKYLSEYEMPAVVSPGEFVHYTARYCLYTDVVPTVRRYFIDGIEYKAQEDSFGLHKGCNTTQVSIHIPETLNAGNYHLRVESDYHMNPIQVIHKANISTMFEIKIPHQDEAQDLIDMQKVTKGE